MRRVSTAELASKIDKMTDALTTLVTTLTSQNAPSVQQSRPVNAPSAKPTGKPTSELAGLAKIYKTVPHAKYNMVKAIYVFADGKPVEKKFYGKARMARHDWAMLKLHGSFQKFTDMPSTN